MSKTQIKLNFDLNKQSIKGLPVLATVRDNNATTKHKAVKPNRHSLAIFVPKICEPTKPTITTGAKARHIYTRPQCEEVTSYDGLIGGNTIAFMVNTPSRLYAVVESRHPFILGDIQITKHKGVAING